MDGPSVWRIGLAWSVVFTLFFCSSFIFFSQVVPSVYVFKRSLAFLRSLLKSQLCKCESAFKMRWRVIHIYDGLLSLMWFFLIPYSQVNRLEREMLSHTRLGRAKFNGAKGGTPPNHYSILLSASFQLVWPFSCSGRKKTDRQTRQTHTHTQNTMKLTLYLWPLIPLFELLDDLPQPPCPNTIFFILYNLFYHVCLWLNFSPPPYPIKTLCL